MDTYDIVVVGGGYSGMTAVDRIAAHRPSVRVALVDGKDEFVERIRLHEAAAGHERKVFRYEPHLKAIGAGFMQGRVESIDTGASRLHIAGADGSRHDWAYRHLILALGSRTNKAVIPGIAEHAVCLDGVEDAAELARWARGGGRLLQRGMGPSGGGRGGGRPAPAEAQPLTVERLRALSPEDQRTALGEELFPRVRAIVGESKAPKITGMLLDLEASDLLHMLQTPAELEAKIQEAQTVLTSAHKA